VYDRYQFSDGGASAVTNVRYSKSILVLDDDFDITIIIKGTLQKNGFTVFAFTDPYLALEHFRLNANDYGLVISDVRMPGMNGFEFVRRVKELRSDIKVVLMTAFKINDIKQSGLLPANIKIDDFIQKPVSMQILASLTEKHIDGLKM
jgi:DNA-binding response OmpR family regulator